MVEGINIGTGGGDVTTHTRNKVVFVDSEAHTELYTLDSEVHTELYTLYIEGLSGYRSLKGDGDLLRKCYSVTVRVCYYVFGVFGV